MANAPANTKFEKTTAPLVAPPTESDGISAERMRLVTGTSDPSLQQKLVMESIGFAGVMDGEGAMLATIAAFESIAPRNSLEGMLAAQMIATNQAAMDCLRRASLKGQSVVGQELNLKHAEKLMQLYVRQLEALDKHRGKSQQKITVEHVTVEPELPGECRERASTH